MSNWHHSPLKPPPSFLSNHRLLNGHVTNPNPNHIPVTVTIGDVRKSRQFNLLKFVPGCNCNLKTSRKITLTAEETGLSKNAETKPNKLPKPPTKQTLSVTEQGGKDKTFSANREAGINDNSVFYIFRMSDDNKRVDAYPLSGWMSCSPVSKVKTMDPDEALVEYENKNRHYSRWYLRAKMQAQTDAESRGQITANSQFESNHQSATGNEKSADNLRLTEVDDWVDSDNESGKETENRSADGSDVVPPGSGTHPARKPIKSNARGKKRTTAKMKENKSTIKAMPQKSGRFRRREQKTAQSESEFSEESDDGDRDADELDYSDDASSSQESSDPEGGYEEKGVDQEFQQSYKADSSGVMNTSGTAGSDSENENADGEGVLTEEGKELVRLLNEFENTDNKSKDESDFETDSSSEFEAKMEQSLKTSKAFNILRADTTELSTSNQSEKAITRQGSKIRKGKRSTARLNKLSSTSESARKKKQYSKKDKK